MKMSEMKILVAFFDKDEVPENSKRIIAQTNSYPVRNGSGHTLDEAVEDLCMVLLAHFHNKRTGRQE